MESSRYLKTQTAVARKSGVSQTTIGRILRGEVDPQCDSLQRIATALKIPLATLLDVAQVESLDSGQKRSEPALIESNSSPSKRAMNKSLRSKEHQAVVTVIAASRREAHTSQEDLANYLGWHRSKIAKIESGERRIDVPEFITIARALSLDPEQLLGRVLRW